MTYASLYVKELRSGKIYKGEEKLLKAEKWENFDFQIPAAEGALLEEMGVCFRINGEKEKSGRFTGLIDELYVSGKPDYSVEFAREEQEQWTNCHWEISQFTKLKGLIYLENGEMHLSCADFAEAYTGRYDWQDYQAEFSFTPLIGEHHMLNIRVQGAIRSYAVAFLPEKRMGDRAGSGSG